MSHMIIAIDQMKNAMILVIDHDVNVKMITNGVMGIVKVCNGLTFILL
jgi:hypothetical protein